MKYDPDTIVTDSQDGHGHSAHLRVHVPKTWGAIMHGVVNSDAWPEYRTTQDILRDALYHRLHWIEQQKNREQVPGVAESIRRERLRTEIERSNLEQEERQQFVGEVEQGLGRRIAAGDIDGARKLLDQAEVVVSEFPEPYRAHAEERMRVWRERLDHTAL